MKNKYLKEFFKRGMAFGGFGPIIAGIIYVILDYTVPDFSLSGVEACIGIVSTYILAFVQAGASVFNQIEEWPVTKSVLFHFISIYLTYTLCYVVNSWIPFEPMVLVIFTLAFVVTYIVIWSTVCIIVKNLSKGMNRKLKNW